MKVRSVLSYLLIIHGLSSILTPATICAVELSKVDIEWKHFEGKRNFLERVRADEELSATIDVRIAPGLYVSQKVAGLSSDTKFEWIAYTMNLDLGILPWLTVRGAHMSQHCLDCVRLPFPEQNSVGFVFRLIGDRGRDSIF